FPLRCGRSRPAHGSLATSSLPSPSSSGCGRSLLLDRLLVIPTVPVVYLEALFVSFSALAVGGSVAGHRRRCEIGVEGFAELLRGGAGEAEGGGRRFDAVRKPGACGRRVRPGTPDRTGRTVGKAFSTGLLDPGLLLVDGFIRRAGAYFFGGRFHVA